MVARAGAAVYPYNYADLWKTEDASGKRGTGRDFRTVLGLSSIAERADGGISESNGMKGWKDQIPTLVRAEAWGTREQRGSPPQQLATPNAVISCSLLP